MNVALYNEFIAKRSGPSQRAPEWRMFLEICETHLKNHNIKNPIAVEVGVFKNRQKKFYEQLLGIRHIGININSKYCMPDVLGNSHDPRTLEILKRKLGGKPINILFIDAVHTYKAVKSDFEMYSPLCTDIIALHDIETGRHWKTRQESMEAWKYWHELKTKEYEDTKQHRRFLFLSIHQCHVEGQKSRQLGIGVIIKR